MLAKKAFPINQSDPAYLATLAREIHSEWIEQTPEISHETLHPCFVSSDACLVTRKGLAQQFPDAYIALDSIANKYGVRVFEDRRSKDVSVVRERRKKMVLAVGLFMGLTMKQTVHAETLQQEPSLDLAFAAVTQIDTRHSHAGLKSIKANSLSHTMSLNKSKSGKIRIGARKISRDKQEQKRLDEIMNCFNQSTAADTSCTQPSITTVHQIQSILQSHLSDKEADSGIQTALENMAYYYAQYPAIVSMLEEMNSLNWTLSISNKIWQARAHIEHDQVKQVDVLFDPGTAAQMLFAEGCHDNPVCTVNPADALLHELLHAWLMLKHPHEYAEQNLHALYPVQHEHEVIHLENQLYSSMSQSDGLPRPHRSRHQASLIDVNCPVCITDES